MKIRYLGTLIGTLAVAALALPSLAFADDDDDDDRERSQQVTVDCSRGETISDALADAIPAVPLVIEVVGICNENVIIKRNDVTLTGIDPNRSKVIGGGEARADDSLIALIGAQNIVIENLSVAEGESSGIVALTSTFTVQDCVIENNDPYGLIVTTGAFSTIDNNVIQKNARDGILVSSGGSARIFNNTIQENLNDGVLVFGAGSARIGRDTGPNIIASNGGDGIQVSASSNANIVSNSIESNGADGIGVFDEAYASARGNTIAFNNVEGLAGGGIGVVEGTVQLNGGNEISQNFGAGIALTNGSLRLGSFRDNEPPFDLIEGNSFVGISGRVSSRLLVFAATIERNDGDGIELSGHSFMRIQNTVVRDNAGSGILIRRDSGARFTNPPATVTGNLPFDVECLDFESSVDGNGDGISVIDPACTGF